MIDIRFLGPGDERPLEEPMPGVFDAQPRQDLMTEFLNDPRHHLAAALEQGRIVGFASAVHYVHPDKPAELWVNEVGVAPSYRRQGIGTRLLRALFEHATELGCDEAWVLTESDNEPALGLYRSLASSGPPADAVMVSFRLRPGAD